MWLALLLLNVFNEFLKNNFGGIGVIAASYVCMLYFLLFYGKRQEKTISILPFCIFYVIEHQYFWDAGRIYTSNGIGFKLQVWHMISLVPAVVSAIQIVSKLDEEMKCFIRKCALGIAMNAYERALVKNICMRISGFKGKNNS